MEDTNSREQFWIELEIAEISPDTLLESDSTTDALLADLTIPRTVTENIWGGVSFQSSFWWQIGKENSNCFKNNYSKDVFR